MKITFLAFIIAILFSCNKKDDVETPVTPVLQDTLATGWSKVVVQGAGMITDVFFVGDKGIISSRTGIYFSNDGGKNWQKNDLLDSTSFNIGMGTAQNAVIISIKGTLNNTVYYTIDGNLIKSAALADIRVSDVFFVGPLKAYAIGDHFWKTENGGQTWTKVSSFVSALSTYNSLHFFSDKVGIAIRGSVGIYKTADGGEKWTKLVTNGMDTYSSGSVYMQSENLSFFSTINSIAKITDIPRLLNVQTPAGYTDIRFITDNIGYYSAGSAVYKTIDGGATWQREVFSGAGILSEIHFTDANHGWACGENGVIMRYQK